jgi:hypothetical protein
MVEDTETRRAQLDMGAMSANVAGDNGIQHAPWWKIVLVIAAIVGILVGSYALVGTRHYRGHVVWRDVGNHWRLELGTTGTVVDFDDNGQQISANGVRAALPAHPSADITSAPAKVSWTPYLFKRDGASGEVVAIDLELPSPP